MGIGQIDGAETKQQPSKAGPIYGARILRPKSWHKWSFATGTETSSMDQDPGALCDVMIHVCVCAHVRVNMCTINICP